MNYVFVFIAIVFFSACSDGSKDDSEYEVIDSGAWAKPIYGRSDIYWLDDENILFAGLDSVTFSPNVQNGVLLVWNYRDGHVYKLNGGSLNYCYKEGRILYGKRLNTAGANNWRTFSASLSKDSGKFVISDEVQLNKEYTKDRSCNAALVPGSEGYRRQFRLKEFDIYVRPIENESEEYKNNPRLGVYAKKELQKLLPLREYGVTSYPYYYKFKDAYYIRSRYQIDERQIGGGERPSGYLRQDWWLFRDLTMQAIPWPPGWEKVNTSPVVMTKMGLVVLGRDYSAPDTGLKDYGIFLLNKHGSRRVVRGRVSGIVTSDDGCKLAFSHVIDERHDRHDLNNSRTLKIVDVCQ